MALRASISADETSAARPRPAPVYAFQLPGDTAYLEAAGAAYKEVRDDLVASNAARFSSAQSVAANAQGALAETRTIRDALASALEQAQRELEGFRVSAGESTDEIADAIKARGAVERSVGEAQLRLSAADEAVERASNAARAAKANLDSAGAAAKASAKAGFDFGKALSGVDTLNELIEGDRKVQRDAARGQKADAMRHMFQTLGAVGGSLIVDVLSFGGRWAVAKSIATEYGLTEGGRYLGDQVGQFSNYVFGVENAPLRERGNEGAFSADTSAKASQSGAALEVEESPARLDPAPKHNATVEDLRRTIDLRHELGREWVA